jgi:uncharacterized membrane protein YccC
MLSFSAFFVYISLFIAFMMLFSSLTSYISFSSLMVSGYTAVLTVSVRGLEPYPREKGIVKGLILKRHNG